MTKEINWWKVTAITATIGLIILISWGWVVPTIYQAGVIDTKYSIVFNLVSQSLTCQPIFLIHGNTTVQLINVECLGDG